MAENGGRRGTAKTREAYMWSPKDLVWFQEGNCCLLSLSCLSCLDINRFYYSFSPLPQTHLIKSSTKMLTLLPGERQAKTSFTQRSCPSAGTRQTSIASFLTSQPGMVSTLKAIRVQKGVHASSKLSIYEKCHQCFVLNLADLLDEL